MRTYEEVKEKALALRQKYLKERIAEYTCRKPVNCIYSHKYKFESGGKGMVCTKQPQKEFTECNCPMSKKCADFVCKNTEESIIAEFNEIVNSPSRCGQEYPKLAVMLWFLQDIDPTVPEKRHSRWFW